MMTGCIEQYTIQLNAKTGKYYCIAHFNPKTREWTKLYNCIHDIDDRMWRVNWPKVGGGGDRNKELTKEELFWKMDAWDKEDFIVGAGTADSGGSAGMVDDHSYSVIECHANVCGTGIHLFKVRNPWGKGEVEDGMFDDDGPGWDQYPQIKAYLKPVVAGKIPVSNVVWRSQRFKSFLT
jgi:Calpain family cysteine protease